MRQPVVNNQFNRLNGLQRCAASFRYVLVCLEHWVSPDGRLREWIKINLRVTVILAAPICLVLPVATFGLWELSLCVGSLTTLVAKLAFLPILVLIILFLLRR